MTVIDQIQNLFAKRPVDSDADSRLSLAMPDQGAGIEPPETVQTPRTVNSTMPAPLRGMGGGAATQADDEPDQEQISVPGLGTRSAAQHQLILGLLMALSLLLVVGITVFVMSRSDRVALQMGASGQSLLQAQKLSRAVSQALAGNGPAFEEVEQSSDMLVKVARGLRQGDGDVSAVDSTFVPTLDLIDPLVERTDKNAKLVLQQKKTLTEMGAALQLISRQSGSLLETAQSISNLKVQQNAPAAEVSAAGQLIMLTQRMGKSSNEFLNAPGVSADVVTQLGSDLANFKNTAQGLLDGSAELRLGPTRDNATRDQLVKLLKQFEPLSQQSKAIVDNLPSLRAARTAQAAIQADSEALRTAQETLQVGLSETGGIAGGVIALLILAAATTLLSAGGLSYVQMEDGRRRQAAAEGQRLEAERQEQDAKRVNDANQAAILRLMNELQTVAEGDLTQEATVTEDITGAIADSVNYTVEELRSLVSNVQTVASQVAQTTGEVDATSTELLVASKEQLHEIRQTGQAVLEMAGRINDVSTQAQESARVARQSLLAAESGLTAVQNAIGGMNAIREQIQETSKRIKRLGESSQEIGEITELISDITEQTNVLALNAAIQAASAGEAGRGFSVVAEEVQRLAERSGDATRQIAALVKAIQTDTQDAIGAMERSTQGVVEGAKLSDNAGTALTEIDRVSRRVADLIEQISNSASREAGLANGVAEDIQHIFAVTEQTGEGTRVTAGQVRELSRMAEELRQSVSRFKIV